jgi:hypothetical protein
MMINFFFVSWRFLYLMAILPAHIRLTVFFASRRFASPGNIIINLASPGQYHHQFGLTVVSLWPVLSFILPHRCTPLDDIFFYSALLLILSSILPHGRAPPALLFFIRPDGHAILAKYFLFSPTVAPLQAKFFL